MTTGSMEGGKFSSQDLTRVALNNGFPRDKDKLVTAVAVAIAESSGNPNAVNTATKSTGLWQVYPAMHPEYDVARLKDPDYNAAAMVKISAGGTNWRPWEAYTTGRYAIYKGYAEIGVMDVLRDPTAGTPGNLDPGAAVGEFIPGDKGKLDPLAAVNAFLSTLLQKAFWRRVLEVVAGIALVVTGLLILNKDTIKKVADVATLGKV